MNKWQYAFARYGVLFGIGLMCIGFFLGIMINISNKDLVGALCGIGFTIMILTTYYVHINEWDIDFYKLETGYYVGMKRMNVWKAMDSSRKNGYKWDYHKDWVEEEFKNQ